MKFLFFALPALASASIQKKFSYNLEMEWWSKAPADACSTAEKTIIDQALFGGTNGVLGEEGFESYAALDELEVEDDRMLRGLQAPCSGPPQLCGRACEYNQRLCMMLYGCDCRRRLLVTSKQVERNSGPQRKLQNMCDDILSDLSLDDDVSDTCKKALENAQCKVSLSHI